MSKFSSVWVFSDTSSRLPELMGGAQHTGEQINVFVLSEADSEAAFHFGADRVWFLRGKPDDRMVEDYAEAIVETLHKHGGEAQSVEWIAPAIAVTRTATQARQSNRVDLDKARLVVSVGRGIGSKENIALAQALCQTIGAELACSRPVAENEKWMEHERYVGISNLMLKPELYLAIGISGQIQHMVGANGSQTICAINKDKNAPIFQYADYGIVGDAVKILPALIQALAR
ncbi:FAD-binding protein [Salmonella enterica]|nr:electron transfer flavoprotein subunit alpha [Salmonella enterica]EDR4374088.1 electron transfer flavoprotein subunit alpha [Salmonella enterica]EEG5731202.1 electron transfer flavoprotein subunit alpha [Salmonella enterica]EEG6155081.1 electron transfer flavoprotein subunit alpha [Salmonella enterica]EEH7432400.1 electron transfer flavoprotein subunit alpha [Salmonella enterica]